MYLLFCIPLLQQTLKVYSCTASLVSIVLVALVTHGVLSMYCLDCDQVSNARDCRKVKQCGPHEVCQHQQYVNPNGFIYRKLGCVDSQFCQSIGKRSFEQVFLNVKKRQAFPVCDTCTTDQITQSSQCRDIGYAQDRGRICFLCDQQHKFECDDITVCSRDDVCYSSLGLSADGHDTVLRTGCLQREACQRASAMVGKRGVVSHRACFECCSDDLCNQHCNASTPATVTGSGSGSSPTTGSFTKAPCVDKTNVATCQTAAIVVCKNITLATNAGCRHTCGFC